MPRATHTRGHVQRVAYTHREGVVEALEARVPRRGVIQAMGQLASELAEDLFRRKRAIFHVFDWPAHEEADAKEGEIDLDAAGGSDRFDELIGRRRR